MNYLVTGGGGFIGSHLVDRLLRDGHRITVLDNFSTGRPENLSQHRGNPDLKVVTADVADLDRIRPYFDDIEIVYHLAALADIVPSIVNPVSYYRSNVSGTAAVVEAARTAGVKKLVYAASSSCYGIPNTYPTPETSEIQPQYPYALTKYLGEQIALHWGKVYKLPVTSLRLFNVYGPRSRKSGAYGAVFGTFLTQKLHHKPYTVVGDWSQTRDFIFVLDVAEAFVMAAESNYPQEVMNAGSGNSYSINSLVELLGGDVVHIPKRPGEPDQTHADITKIKRLLGWEPRVTFEAGVNILVKHIDYWREAPLWTPDSIGEATKDWFRYLS